MNLFRITMILSLLSLFSANQTLAKPIPKDLDLFLLLGQSNMSGRNKVQTIDQTTVPGIYMLNKKGKWELAKEPLHFDMPGRSAVGPGFAFARALKKKFPNRNIGLIPCAVGATPIKAWKPKATFKRAKHFYKPYDDAIKRTKIALNQGQLKGILWLQGEADSKQLTNAKAYHKNITGVIERLRYDLKAYATPIVLAELGPFLAKHKSFPHYALVNQALNRTAKLSPNIACISSQSLTSKGDNVHFDSPSIRILGARYADAYIKLIQNKARVVNLWSHAIPLALKTDLKEIIRPGKRISKIVTPTLTIYHPKNLKANCPAVVILPGGGYGGVSHQYEGDQIANWCNQIGISAFVLKYRLAPHKHPVPLLDAQEAIRYIRRHVDQLEINPQKIGVIGFSAGGHLAASLALQSEVHFTLKNTFLITQYISPKPNFAILGYPVISMKKGITHNGSRRNLLGKNPSEKLVNQTSNELLVTPNSPPMFLFHGKGDRVVKLKNATLLLAALKKNKVPAQLKVFPTQRHGFGMQFNWMTPCQAWLKKQHIIQ